MYVLYLHTSLNLKLLCHQLLYYQLLKHSVKSSQSILSLKFVLDAADLFSISFKIWLLALASLVLHSIMQAQLKFLIQPRYIFLQSYIGRNY